MISRCQKQLLLDTFERSGQLRLLCDAVWPRETLKHRKTVKLGIVEAPGSRVARKTSKNMKKQSLLTGLDEVFNMVAIQI